MPDKFDPFVHLHVHLDKGSVLDSYSTPAETIAEAARLGQPAMAVTDHGSLAAVYDFYQEGKKQGVNTIAGCEMYVVPSPGNIDTKSPIYLGTYEKGESPSRDDVSGRGAYTHMTVLAENQIGLRNLFRLNEVANVRGYYLKPRISLEMLEEYHEGLIVTTGCPSGEVQTEIRLGHFDKALAYAARLVDIMGKENVFVELMDHGMMQDLERKVRKDLIEIARLLNLKIVATNDLHYARHEDAKSHEEMLAIQTRSSMAEKPDYEGGKRFAFEGNGSYYVKSAAEMLDVFPEDQFPGAVSNTLLIAERSGFEVNFDDTLRPAVPIPDGYTEDSWLRKESFDGLARRLPGKADDPEYVARLEKELRVLKQKGFSGYFLVVSDFIRWAKFRAEPRIPMGPGRGSAAGSLIAYCLDITDADPIRFDLLFERFLNEERDSPPDIDIDVSDLGRTRLINYVRDTYGEEQVALVITYGTIGAKQALKDIVRIYDEPFDLGNRLSKALPPPIFGKEIKLKEVFDTQAARYPEAGEFRDLVEREHLDHIVQPALKLEGRVRSHGTHAAAVIISNQALVDHIPIGKSQKLEMLQTQWDYPTAESMGLIKMDFLGLRNLGIIDEAVHNIKRTRGVDLDIPALVQGAMDDPKVYDMLQRGDTLGVFQLDGGGLRGLLKVLKPTSFDDISAVLSLYRPGPMGVGAHMQYALRKNGLQEITPIHEEFAESLKDILEPTYGTIIYQEQVQRIAQIVANYSLAEADLLRRAMGKKKRYIIDAEYENFRPRAIANGYSPEAIQVLWDILVPFADYAFNKCVTGDAEVWIKTESGNVIPMRVEDMFKAHQERSLSGRGIKVYAFDPERNNFYFDNVKDIMDNGEQEVFEVVTSSGRSITATADHRHMTPLGMKKVKDLVVGDRLLTVKFSDDMIRTYNTLKMWSGPRAAAEDEIVAIRPVGVEQTYDLEMHGEFHNYVANGIVTHNSHTVAYGITSYVTAYLKANYMAEYMAALLTSVANNTDKTAEYLEDCRQHGIKVTVPDVNKSGVAYEPISPTEIAFGFGAIKGVGAGVSEEIVQWRRDNGEFKSFNDFLNRAPKAALNKKVVEALALGGGFDALPGKSGINPETGRTYAPYSRQSIYNGIEATLKEMSKARMKATTAERKKFKDADKAVADAAELERLSAMAEVDLTVAEKRKLKALLKARDAKQAAALDIFGDVTAPDMSAAAYIDFGVLSGDDVLIAAVENADVFVPGLRATPVSTDFGKIRNSEFVVLDADTRSALPLASMINAFKGKAKPVVVSSDARLLADLSDEVVGLSKPVSVAMIAEAISQVMPAQAPVEATAAEPIPETDYDIPPMEEWAKLEKLKLERTALGLYISGHPLDELNMEGMASQKVMNLIFQGEGEDRVDPVVPPLVGWPGRDAKPQRIAGIVTQLTHRRTKKGDSMASGVIEDRTGSMEFVVFPKAYSGDPLRGTAGFGELLKLDGVYQLTGFSTLRDESVTFTVDALRPLEFGQSGALSVRVKLTTGQWERGRDMLESIFKQFPAREGARTNVIVSLKSPEGKISEETLDVQVNPSPALTQRIREVFGMLAIGRWRSAR